MNITKRAKNIKQQWWLINAENKILGRLATRIADILTGKRKVYYSHDIVCGDCVIVINAEKVELTGNKIEKKIYQWHTGYPGHLKERNAREMLKRKPEYLLIKAVTGMLPKNKLQAKLLKNLKVYAGEKHPHKAQEPILLEIEKKKGIEGFIKVQQNEAERKEEKKVEEQPQETEQTKIHKREEKESEEQSQKAKQIKTKEGEGKGNQKQPKKISQVNTQKIENKKNEKHSQKTKT